jgi:hypothetical protein
MTGWEGFSEKFRRAEQRQQEQMGKNAQEKAAMGENEGKAMNFISTIAQQAFLEIEQRLQDQDIKDQIVPKGLSITIHAFKPGGLPTATGDFEWTVAAIPTPSGIVIKASGTNTPWHTIQVHKASETPTEDDIVKSFIDDFSSVLEE